MSDADVDVVPDDGDILAAEYVIGLLTRDEAHAVEVRAITDPGIARSILQWQEWLSDLALDLKPVPPPPEVWQRLAAALPSMDLAPYRQSLPPPQPRRLRQPRRWRFGSKSAWRGGLIGGVGGAALAVAVGAALVGPKLWTSPPGLAALLASGADAPAYEVMLTRDGYASVLALNPDYPDGGALQLWTMDGATPVSLGLLPRQGRFRITKRLVPGAKLLISREPKGGSPDAVPSGPVVYQGQMIKG